ncbi:hypothetical protein BKA64DRAFT_426612 [Cadophora sp. MPI-SDFR-AT-0126]|nr:hypothetical protein BKA64DRAFT_426612 [Leotiomycetes sp. MPI-SDFR-AT-0126]
MFPPSPSSQGWMSEWGTLFVSVFQARVELAVSICLLLLLAFLPGPAHPCIVCCLRPESDIFCPLPRPFCLASLPPHVDESEKRLHYWSKK